VHFLGDEGMIAVRQTVRKIKTGAIFELAQGSRQKVKGKDLAPDIKRQDSSGRVHRARWNWIGTVTDPATAKGI
jgi:hypothetical protein